MSVFKTCLLLAFLLAICLDQFHFVKLRGNKAKEKKVTGHPEKVTRSLIEVKSKKTVEVDAKKTTRVDSKEDAIREEENDEDDDDEDEEEDERDSSSGAEKERREEKTNKGPKIWDQWGKWSPCSVTCGIGKIIRWRHCVGGGCAPGEKEAQIKTCTLPAC